MVRGAGSFLRSLAVLVETGCIIDWRCVSRFGMVYENSEFAFCFALMLLDVIDRI
jgi:hypothetical protein